MKNQKCCICGAYIAGYGHNPRPVKDKGECCDACNFRFVVPARIELYKKRYGGKKNEKANN